MINNAININNTNNRLSPQFIEHKKNYIYGVGNPDPCLGYIQQYSLCKLVSQIPTLPSDDWSSNDDTDIYTNIHIFVSTQKDYTLSKLQMTI